MITLEHLYKELKTLNIPCQYHHFDINQVPELPYIIYYNHRKTTTKADNVNYLIELHVTIELYTNYKDLSLEKKIETLLNALNIMYDYQETYLSDEQMYLVVYEIIL